MTGRIIAEVGSVHDGSFGNACQLIAAAAAAGADTVKFQTHIAAAETLPSAPSPAYFATESRAAYFERTAFTEQAWKRLATYAREAGVEFLSSPFSLEAVDLLERVGVAAYKVPSGEVTNIPLLERLADVGKPVLLSSGMSTWSELDAAVGVLAPRVDLTVMQCSSVYPCPPDLVGLNILADLRTRYQLPMGFSDHTLGFAAPIAAAALGATAIEKHFTFSRLMYGSDAAQSMEPSEFAVLCNALRDTWAMMESPVDKDDLRPYTTMKIVFEKSIVSRAALAAGTTLSMDQLAFKKPGDGIPASQYRAIVGRRLVRDVPENYQFRNEDLQ